jgi:polyisoprenoid-binding protein YceI
MRKLLTLLALVTLSAFSQAAPVVYTLDASHTYPSFEIKHLFSTQRGRFDKTTGTIVLDSESKTGKLDFSIDVNSVNTGFALRDEHLRSEKLFDSKKYPTLTFVSKELVFNNAVLTGAEGILTVHGVSKPIHLNISDFACGKHPYFGTTVCGAFASTSIKRSEFGMDYGIPMVGDEVKILIQVEATEVVPAPEN